MDITHFSAVSIAEIQIAQFGSFWALMEALGKAGRLVEESTGVIRKVD